MIVGGIHGGEPSGVEAIHRVLADETGAGACSRLFDLRAGNFRRVDRGEVWAEADGEKLVADHPFVPVLMSECGYRDICGYKGQKVGETLAEARAAWGSYSR